MKLSVIVPIYNVEAYLRKCVESLLAQDYVNYEIILVDDGSTDNSGRIADELARGNSEEVRGKNGPVIRVIHQENQGLSGARNTGILAAKGEYVCFVDSDDYWEINVLNSLMEQIEREDLDVLRFRFRNVRQDGSAFKPFKGNTYANYTNVICDGAMFISEYLGFACYSWAFIVRRSIVASELFTIGIYFEDTDWTPRMLLKARKVANADVVVYNYLWREGSITLSTSLDKKHKIIDDKLKLIKTFKNLQENLIIQKWVDWQIQMCTLSIISMVLNDFEEETNACIDIVKQLQVLPLSYYRAETKKILKIWLFNLSPKIYCRIITKYFES